MGHKATKGQTESISERGIERQSEREHTLVNIRPYRGLVLMQHLVVSAERNTENDGRDILKTVDPLLPLRPLTSHIKEPDGQRDRRGKPTYLLHITTKMNSYTTSFPGQWGQIWTYKIF